MAFMQPEYSDQPFHLIETRGGETHAIPADVYGTIERAAEEFDTSPDRVEIVEDKVFCRLQAPGYLDATDWSGPFDTLVEARASIRDDYNAHPDTGEDLDDWIETARDEFTDGYIECALWCGVLAPDEEGNLDSYSGDEFGRGDLTEACNVQMVGDAHTFFKTNLADLIDCGLDMGQAGHDFWLTRNRHGAGYWDRKSMGGIRDAALDRLTTMSHAYGEMNLVVEDHEGTEFVGLL
jgi:hypothetical protein